MDGGFHFRMRIILRTILIWFLVFHVCVPECSRNGSGACPYLWVQRKFVEFRQCTQSARLCPADFLGQFFSAFSLSETCVIYSSSILGKNVFRDWPFPGRSSCVSVATAANYHLLLIVAILLKERCYSVVKTGFFFIC